MSLDPRAIVLAPLGPNRASDVAFALTCAGAAPQVVSIADLLTTQRTLLDAQMLVVAGGFSDATPLGAGRGFSFELAHSVGDQLRSFVAAGKPVVGIASGFQALVRTGILPGALALNASGHFQCEWVELEAPATRCLWTQGLSPIECPLASSESRYVHPDPETLADNGQVALRYRHTNPNGSVANIAGVCDTTGVVLGLMPNPEHHVLPRQHPQYRMPQHTAGSRLALAIFERGVRHVRKA